MRPFAAAAVLLLVAAAASTTHAKCANGVVERREWRTLSADEQKAYIRAVRKLQEQPGGAPSVYDKLVNIHNVKAGQIHSVPNFLPWHRLFLFVFETLLRRIDPSVAVPYWNWQLDSQAPELADIWSDDGELGFGKNGDPTQGYCVKTGAFAGWNPKYPTPHCLRRQWSELDRIAAFYSTDNIQNLLVTARNYLAFEPGLERVPHGQVHNAIGGDVGDLSMMYSPNDPVFWLHHSNLDKIWADWQALYPNGMKDYGGTNYDGTPAALTDILVGFKAKAKDGSSVDITVGQVMNIGNLCYKYKDMDVNAVDGTVGGGARLLRRQGGGIDPKDLQVKDGVPPPDAPHNCARGMPTLLLVPEILPVAWILMNKGREDDYRGDERHHGDIIKQVNALPDYISNASPWNQPWRLKRIIVQVESLFIFAKGKQVILKTPNGGDPLQNVQAIRDAVKAALGGFVQKNPAELQKQLEPILGPRPANGIGGINNPWGDRH